MKYKRVLLKLSGEALAGEKGYGVCPETVKKLSQEIKIIHDSDVELAIVVGGGNIHRGSAGQLQGLHRTTSDHMGMLGTVINALVLQDTIEKLGPHTRVLSGVQMREFAEPYVRRRAIRHLEKRRIVIFAAGLGSPYFTTDTAAAQRASEIDADIILKATKVDGIYDQDPEEFPDAQKFDELDYEEVLRRGLKVMDTTAIAMCMENHLHINVFSIKEEGNIIKAVKGESIGTLVVEKK